MLLSVLIPTHNHDCTELVSELSVILPPDAEILVGDDASTDPQVKRRLEKLGDMPCCRLYQATQNLGRAAIRNRLADEARGEWLIFIDSDAKLMQQDFIQRYLEARQTDVVCGGTAAPRSCPSPEVSLRFRYESHYWATRTAQARSLSPYVCFTTFNFMIRRAAFMAIRFNEECRQYGHEDTLFGIDLKKGGISLQHIDNALIHMGLEPNPVFLQKTEESLRALIGMDPAVAEGSRILRWRRRLDRLRLTPLVRVLHKILGPLEKRQLCSRHPDLHIFTLYKIGYLCSLDESAVSHP